MLIHVDLVVVYMIICIVQGATAAGMLLAHGRTRPSARWTALWLLAVTLQVIDYTLSRSGTYYRHHELYFLPLFYTLALGPLLFGSVRSARTTEASLGPVHFIPVVVQAAFYVIMCVQPVETKAQVWMSLHKPVTRWLEYYGALVSLGLYLAAAWRLVGGDEPAARRLRQGGSVTAVFLGASAIDPLVNAHYLPVGAPRFWLFSLGLPLLGGAVALWAMFGAQVQQAAGLLGLREPSMPSDPDPVAPAAAGINEARRAPDPALVARLRTALERDRVYRDSELTLDALAARVGVSANVASQALNAGLGGSFSELINRFRLADVMTALDRQDVRSHSVLAVAFAAGFNSKSTFNRVFRAHTGMTPREYRNRPPAGRDAGPGDTARPATGPDFHASA